MKQLYKVTSRSEATDAAGNPLWTLEAIPVDAAGKPIISGTAIDRIWQSAPGKSLQYTPADATVAQAIKIGSTVTLTIEQS